MKKKMLFTLCMCIVFAFTLCGCSQKATYRMESVSYLENGERITLGKTELLSRIEDNYIPQGEVEDNFFLTLEFQSKTKGRAVFLFSEISPTSKDVIADNFVIQSEKNSIELVFSNGSTLSGTKKGKYLNLSANNISYVFKKI